MCKLYRLAQVEMYLTVPETLFGILRPVVPCWLFIDAGGFGRSAGYRQVICATADPVANQALQSMAPCKPATAHHAGHGGACLCPDKAGCGTEPDFVRAASPLFTKASVRNHPVFRMILADKRRNEPGISSAFPRNLHPTNP